MRAEISHKFIMGFIIVVGCIVTVNLVVPFTGIPEQWQQLFSVACAILVGLVLGLFFSRTFTANIRSLSDSAEYLAKGDLSRDVELPKTLLPDETADLADSLNRVVTSLRELVGYIRSSSVKVAEAAEGVSATSEEMTASAHEVANAVEQISGGAETQAEMVEKSSRLIKELAVSIDLVAASAKKVSASASDTAGTARKGGEIARSTLKRIKQVLGDVEQNSERMFSFGVQVQKIGKIVEVITGIAQKTNLLALNATIEAARAGEYGRGFAVVAEEISKLADSTSDSAGEITRLIEEIQEQNHNLQASTKESIHELDAGREALDRTGHSFEDIIRTTDDTQTKATSIAELAESQTKSASSIVSAIDEIARVVSDNAAATQQVSAASQQQSASMEELSHAAQDLAALAEDLLGKVSSFKLGNEKGA